jgi:hypothetical protein
MLQLLYISVVIVFLTCCNRSSSGCNHFSFMFANRCTHVACVLEMLQVSHVNVSKLDINFSM